MTYEEAIRLFKQRAHHPRTSEKKVALYSMALEALEKQMPLKPSMFDNCGNVTATDRCCKCYEIIWNNYSHCPYCGQAIDWSD